MGRSSGSRPYKRKAHDEGTGSAGTKLSKDEAFQACEVGNKFRSKVVVLKPQECESLKQ